MIMKILSIEIPPILNCNSNQITIITSQIQNSRSQIGASPSGTKAQIKFQFTIEFSPAQKPDVDCLMKLPNPINCEALLTEVVSNTSNKVKSQLSFDGSNYILTAII